MQAVTLISNANVADQWFMRKPALRSTGPNFSWGQNRTKLVDKPIRTLRREINHQFKPLYDSNIRCFRFRFGEHMRIAKFRRVLVLNPANLSRKCKGTFISFFALQSFVKLQRKTQILITIDNVTVVAHFNRMDGIKSC